VTYTGAAHIFGRDASGLYHCKMDKMDKISS
jgi:hypothetical protein